ncbi:MAG: type II secretion system protein [Natronincolaceae bacterium]|jgi:prepilin-type N-terminal cleavage/methylation domain-containing protein|nr:type II secretion system protein [Bacillota bacterium]
MKITLLGNMKYKKKGLTLIEVILSLAILGIIIVPFLNIFVFSTVTNRKSENILDATYVAQNIMEQRYAESKNENEIPESEEYPDPFGVGYWVEETIDNEGNLVRVIIKIYSDDNKNKLEAQMETYLLWNSD